jgi:cytochrome c oxidase subunit 2
MTTPDESGRRASRARALAGALLLGLACGCAGPQSTLDPAGVDAERIFRLFSWMAGGAAVVWMAVMALALWATYAPRGPAAERTGRRLIVLGGAVAPTVILGALVVYGLWLLPILRPESPDEGPIVEVTGEQWWWRVRYRLEDGRAIELANEIRLAAGRRTELRLESADVIHSLWIPALAGKMDMIPGRTTRLVVEPRRTGELRGVCAEYCGTAHALMAFRAVVVEPAELDRWLERQAGAAPDPGSALAARGQESFLAHGCGACHSIRGTEADGVLGPDLTHVASRRTIGAGTLPADAASYARWLSRTERVKPGVHMPSFGMLPAGEIGALAAYLAELE